MFISDNREHRKLLMSVTVKYALAALFCAIFGAVYEVLSHGVYSGFMLYAFVIPLLGGAAVFLAVALLRKAPLPGKVLRQLYGAGIAAFTVGCIMRGVLDIYGTSNALVAVYPWAGSALCLSAAAIYAAGAVRQKRNGEYNV